MQVEALRTQLADAQAIIAALQARVRELERDQNAACAVAKTFEQMNDENTLRHIIEKLQVDLAQRTAELEAVQRERDVWYARYNELSGVKDRQLNDLQADLERVRGAFAKTTKGKVTINRYEHGGGRMFVDDGKNRHLIADTYNKGDREFIALCYEVFSGQAALTATSQPAKEPVRHLCGARGFGQSLDDRCPGCAVTSQEGQHESR